MNELRAKAGYIAGRLEVRHLTNVVEPLEKVQPNTLSTLAI